MAEESYFDSEQCIIEVEKRPALYNKQLPEYSDKNTKAELWSEVCETLVPNWFLLDAEKQRVKSQDVQRKWRNIRDHFRRELNMQNKTRSRTGQRKRRKYIYFDQLLFLLPSMRQRGTAGKSGTGDEDPPTILRNNETNTTKPPTDVKRQIKIKHPKKVEDSREEISRPNGSNVEEIDEDKYFLMSLLPSFKKLDDQQKLTAKVEVLQVIQRVTHKNTQ